MVDDFNVVSTSKIDCQETPSGGIHIDTSTSPGYPDYSKHELVCIPMAAIHIDTSMSMICTRTRCFCAGSVFRQPVRVNVYYSKEK